MDFLLISKESSGLPVLLWRACHSRLVSTQPGGMDTPKGDKVSECQSQKIYSEFLPAGFL